VSYKLLEDREESYPSSDTLPCFTNGWFETIVSKCSLELNFIISPWRNFYMLTEAFKVLTERINDGIPGI
jgi:hypothetical protein